MLLQKLFQLKQQWLFYFIWTLLNNSNHFCLYRQSPIFKYLASSQWSWVTWFLFMNEWMNRFIVFSTVTIINDNGLITFFNKTCAHKNIEQFFMPCWCHLTLNAEHQRHWLFFGMAAMPFLCNTKLSSESSESNKSVLWTIVFMLKRINDSFIHYVHRALSKHKYFTDQAEYLSYPSPFHF